MEYSRSKTSPGRASAVAIESNAISARSLKETSAWDTLSTMSKRKTPSRTPTPAARAPTTRRPSSLLDTRVIYCGDNLEQLAKLPDGCVDLIYISQIRRGGDPPFNSNRNYEVFWGETKEKRAFEDRHASTAAYIDYMSTDLAESGGRPRCQELARVLKPTGSFYDHSLRLARDPPVPRLGFPVPSAAQLELGI
jgi:hypothetical protein